MKSQQNIDKIIFNKTNDLEKAVLKLQEMD